MRKLIIISALFYSCSLYAQNIMNNKFHLLNHSLLNPAYLSTFQTTTISLFSSHKWLNVKHSPTNQGLLVNGFSNENAWSTSLLSNRWGNFSHISMQIAYSYKAKLSDNWNLSTGLNANISQYTLNQTNYKPADENDLALSYQKDKTISPNFNAGIILFNNQHFFGISIINMLENKYKFTINEDNLNEIKRHFVISGAYNFELNEKISVKPIMYAIKNNYSKLFFEMNTIGTFDNKYYVGLGYNTNKEISLTSGLFFKEFQFSYTFGFNTFLSSYINSSLHEFTFSYRIKNNSQKKLL